MRFTLFSGVIVFFLGVTKIQAVSMVKPGCFDKCGNVNIPYPFGIGPLCSANSSFTITCNNSSVPILSKFNLEAVNISLEEGLISVKQPLAPLKCSSEQKTASVPLSLKGSPFTFAPYNSLVVFGCHNEVWLRDNERGTIYGCQAYCGRRLNPDTNCRGAQNCCSIPVAGGVQELEFTYRTVDSYSSGNQSCGHVFLVEQEWPVEHNGVISDGNQPSLSDPVVEESNYTVLVLEWALDDKNLSYYADTGCYSSRSPCACVTGFEGNPYLADGCLDIDECSSNSTPAVCDGLACTNTDGSFECDFPYFFRHPHHHVQKTAFTIFGSILGTVLLFIGWRCSKVLNKRLEAKRRIKFFKRNGGLLLEQHLSATGYGVEKIRLFKSKELARATDHYNENRVLGRGGQGTVYKGMLTDGKIVAVKKSKKINECDVATFINEVVILSHINHRNIVKLLGCCLETEIPLLVYEFIPNGTLFQHIHDPNEEFPLTWEMRVRISTDVAYSLSYLHSAASIPVYHRDIKSSNILLDEKYRAKVSDFGTSRSVAIDQTHLTTRVLGTFGYLDPEYFRSSQFTEKSDVYSFGVVVVELLTGEKAVSAVRADEGKSLAIHFLQSMEEDKLFEILDPLVLREGPREEIVAIAGLARRCLHLNGKRRPTMKEVAAALEGIKKSNIEGTNYQHDEEEDEEEQRLHSIYRMDEFNGSSSLSGSVNFESLTSSTSSSDVHPILIEEP